ncbi:Branchpoint-bridging protein [Fusarium sp. Ph1]|nr:Branchpoint-bridging protein [Fusarium sp. Ph1]
MRSEQLDVYVVIFCIDEITEQLRAERLDPTNRPRCLREERHQLVETAMRTVPAYRPPYDYRRPMIKTSETAYLPVTDFLSVNFIGQILSPRGRSVKVMDGESDDNIFPCGRGAVKEGRGRACLKTVDYDREPLHCLITADSQQKIDKAKRLRY